MSTSGVLDLNSTPSSSPLPSGAATAANQVLEITALDSIDSKLTDTASGLKVDGSAVTQPISATSLPLPAGAATDTNQATEITALQSIDSKTPAMAYAVRLDNTSTANVTYVGKAVTGSVTSAALWQIQKIDQSSGLSITWAGGSASFTNIWNNRTSLSYS